MTSSKRKVLLLGHSFLVRLENYCRKEGKANMDLSNDIHRITFRCRGGKYISHLENDLQFIDRIKPYLLCLDIATNDIEQLSIKDKTVDPDVLARQVFDFAQRLVSCHGVKVVVIMEVLNRTKKDRKNYGTKSVSQFRTAAAICISFESFLRVGRQI